MKFTGFVWLVAAIWLVVCAQQKTMRALIIKDPLAKSKCQALYQTSVIEDNNTYFLHNECTVQCNIFGQTVVKNQINEGQSCPPSINNPKFVCQSGHCQPRRRNVQTPKLKGFFSIGSTSASLSSILPNVYLVMCVPINLSYQSNKLFLSEDDWQQCYSCSSDLAINTANPTWVLPCPDTQRYTIRENSELILELWTWDNDKTFVGGVRLNFGDLIQNKDYNKPISLALRNGSVSGSLVTQINWFFSS